MFWGLSAREQNCPDANKTSREDSYTPVHFIAKLLAGRDCRAGLHDQLFCLSHVLYVCRMHVLQDESVVRDHSRW